MQLEIKHVKGYLNHKLKMIFSNGEIIEVKGIVEDVIYYDTYERRSIHISHLKPLLRSLSDLTKEIEHNGEKFVPMNRAIFLGCRPEWLINDLRDTMSYKIYEWLIEHHFDVFGLIENNLAIDINTLK